MRGDRPSYWATQTSLQRFTPHARGSTLTRGRENPASHVYPACAGIDLYIRGPYLPPERLPRMRGDRPDVPRCAKNLWGFTPHARGSTVYCSIPLLLPYVYPACAGIDRGKLGTAIHLPGLPRMRGDRPKPRGKYWTHVRFTPHARGSTLSRI